MLRMITAIALTTMFAVGCGNEGADVGEGGKTEGTKGKTTELAKHGAHDGWWCSEHGIPEEECSMCSTKAADKFKKAGDWCKKHNRADSQCFICHPERKEHYAKLYRAKFGKEPPKVEE